MTDSQYKARISHINSLSSLYDKIEEKQKIENEIILESDAVKRDRLYALLNHIKTILYDDH